MMGTIEQLSVLFDPSAPSWRLRQRGKFVGSGRTLLGRRRAFVVLAWRELAASLERLVDHAVHRLSACERHRFRRAANRSADRQFLRAFEVIESVFVAKLNAGDLSRGLNDLRVVVFKDVLAVGDELDV